MRDDGSLEISTLLTIANENNVAVLPMPPDELAALTENLAKGDASTLWLRNVVGMLLHVPDHWIAVTPPTTSGSACLLCDSLDAAPFALSAAEVKVLLDFISDKQKNARLTAAGTWSCYRLSVNAGP